MPATYSAGVQAVEGRIDRPSLTVVAAEAGDERPMLYLPA
jgi:hypothetical protein